MRTVGIDQDRGAKLRRSYGSEVAFSLVELLVVIAVIAILASLLLPAFSRAKASARSASCKNNLWQMGVGLRIYLDDHRVYPLWPGWDKKLLPSTGGNPDLFLCPARQPFSAWTNFNSFPPAFAHNPTYGYNVFGTGLADEALGLIYDALTERPEPQVVLPSDMITIGDSPEYQRQDGDIGGALDDPADYVADRHDGGANVLFSDCHVEYGKQTNWMNPIEATRQRWNYDHQPHRETWH